MNANPPALQSVQLSVPSPVANYLSALRTVCPFIEPSARAGLLWGCVISPDCKSVPEIHPRVFEQVVPLIERFRDARRALPEKQHRLLICHVVILHMPLPLDAETARQLTWPNWLSWAVKQLYTPKEIVFGFVRKGVAEKTQSGIAIPVCPFHAIVIRSRVVGSDHRFFPGNQPWLEAMMEADDDGGDVHSTALGQMPDLRDPQALRVANYFERVKTWGQQLLGASEH
jgi:hypothetical protein